LIAAQLTDSEKANVTSAQVSGRYIASVIAKNVSMEMADFNRYNPGFDNTLATGETYNMQLPSDKMKEFFDKKYVILNESVQQLLQSVNTNSNSVFEEKSKKKK
jgi:membrane-bound lytic murein transglycosylase D